MAEIFEQDYIADEKPNGIDSSEWILKIMCAPFELIEKIKEKVSGILEKIQRSSTAIVAEADKDFNLKLGDEDRGMCEINKEFRKPSKLLKYAKKMKNSVVSFFEDAYEATGWRG